jgi:hypothetical protein
MGMLHMITWIPYSTIVLIQIFQDTEELEYIFFQHFLSIFLIYEDYCYPIFVFYLYLTSNRSFLFTFQFSVEELNKLFISF